MSILNELFAEMVLLDEDRESLMKDRGFREDIINESMFRSVDPLNEKIVLELLQKHGRTELLRDKLIDYEKNVNPILTNRIDKFKIIIPFFKDDTIIYWRGHKFCLNGFKPPVFVPKGVTVGDELILAESEYKAVALRQWGYFGVGLCGITMYKSKHYPELVNFIRNHKPKRVTILWDNDNQLFDGESFKERCEKRFHVESEAYFLAYKLEREEDVTSDVRIATLPKEWRIDDKIDLDKALATGKTKQDIHDVLYDAVDCNTYRDNWEQECKDVCQRRIEKFFFRSDVIERDGKYVKCKVVKDEIVYKDVTNFTMDLVSNLIDDNGEVKRMFVLSDVSGTKSKPLIADALTLSQVTRFSEWLLTHGNYNFMGSLSDLTEIRKRLFTFDENLITYNPFREGYFDGGYLFRDVRVSGGKVFKAGDDGIIWDGRTGYLSESLSNTAQGRLSARISDKPFDYVGMFGKLVDNWNIYDPVFGIGWAISAVYSDAFWEKYGVFPILWVTGEPGGGKTSFNQLISACHGMNHIQTNVKDTTLPSMLRTLGYYGNMAVWYDEYIDEKAIENRHGFFRSVYNRQGATKSDRFSERKIHHTDINGCLMISGTVMPNDDALAQRCIHITLSKASRNGSTYKWLAANRNKFSYMYYDLAMRRDEILPRMLETADDCLEKLVAEWELDERYAVNYAIILAALEEIVPGIIGSMDEFHEWCKEKVHYEQMASSEEHILNMFLNDIAKCYHEKDDAVYERDCMKVSTSKRTAATMVFVNPKNAYNMYSKYLRTMGRYPSFSERNIRDYMVSAGWKSTSAKMESRRTVPCLAAPIKEILKKDIRDMLILGSELDEEKAVVLEERTEEDVAPAPPEEVPF